MSVAQKYHSTLAHELKSREQMKDFQEGLAFLERLEKAGMLEKPKYNISPIDTIGRRLHQKQRSPLSW